MKEQRSILIKLMKSEIAMSLDKVLNDKDYQE